MVSVILMPPFLWHSNVWTYIIAHCTRAFYLGHPGHESIFLGPLGYLYNITLIIMRHHQSQLQTLEHSLLDILISIPCIHYAGLHRENLK